MNNDTVVSLAAPARVSDPLTELLRTGARRLIEAAVSAEFEEYLSGFVQEQLPDGRQRARRRVGVLVGGRHLQRPSQRVRAAVRAGGHWRERPRRETLPGHRGRGARVHPELARGAAGDEAARLHAPGEARRGRRGTGVLGGSVGGISNDPNAALLDAQDRERPELPPEVWPGEGQAGTARDLDGRNEGAGRACLRRVARALRRQVPQGHRLPARDRDELLAFYDFPAAHWTHLRTTNVIESAFATIRHRSSRAKGCVTRQLAKVIEGVKFNDGIELIEDSRAAA